MVMHKTFFLFKIDCKYRSSLDNMSMLACSGQQLASTHLQGNLSLVLIFMSYKWRLI